MKPTMTELALEALKREGYSAIRSGSFRFVISRDGKRIGSIHRRCVLGWLRGEHAPNEHGMTMPRHVPAAGRAA